MGPKYCESRTVRRFWYLLVVSFPMYLLVQTAPVERTVSMTRNNWLVILLVAWDGVSRQVAYPFSVISPSCHGSCMSKRIQQVHRVYIPPIRDLGSAKRPGSRETLPPFGRRVGKPQVGGTYQKRGGGMGGTKSRTPHRNERLEGAGEGWRICQVQH